MANRYLLPLYKELYNRDFEYSNFDQRLEMQKAIYLLQDMGVPTGDYGFRWYHHGPYSQALQDDMYHESGRPCRSIMLSREHADSVRRLQNAIHSSKRGSYSVATWVECLASLHYLQENLLSFNATPEEVLGALKKRKPHLDDSDANSSAYYIVEELFA